MAVPPPPAPELAAVPLETLHHFLDTATLGRLQCVSTLWRDEIGCADYVWVAALSRDFGVVPPPVPRTQPPAGAGAATPSPSPSRLQWMALMRSARIGTTAVVHRHLPARAARVWRALREFTAAHGIDAQLRGGASADELASLERTLGVSLPRAARALYSACGGQPPPQRFGAAANEARPVRWSQGVLGGSAVYGGSYSTFVLPLQNACDLTHLLRTRLGLDARFVAFTSPPVVLVLDCGDGHTTPRGGVYALCRSRVSMLLPVARGAAAIPSSARAEGEGPLEDALLSWFEEYVRRLHCGEYTVATQARGDDEEEDEDDAETAAVTGSTPPPRRYISLFPASGHTGTSVASTCRIHTSAASHLSLFSSSPSAHVALPVNLAHGREDGNEDEMAGSGDDAEKAGGEGADDASLARAVARLWPALGGGVAAGGGGHASLSGSFCFDYRIRLWREATPPDERPHRRCITLKSRRWDVRDCTEDGTPYAHVETVEGPGVIGLYPRLDIGSPSEAEPFSYCSRTVVKLSGTHPFGGANMSGHFLFGVDGDDAGEDIRVPVAAFEMCLGGFLY